MPQEPEKPSGFQRFFDSITDYANNCELLTNDGVVLSVLIILGGMATIGAMFVVGYLDKHRPGTSHYFPAHAIPAHHQPVLPQTQHYPHQAAVHPYAAAQPHHATAPMHYAPPQHGFLAQQSVRTAPLVVPDEISRYTLGHTRFGRPNQPEQQSAWMPFSGEHSGEVNAATPAPSY